MKKRTGILMMLALAAVVLTACTRADKGTSGAASGNSTAAGSGTIEASNNDSTSTGTVEQGTANQGTANQGTVSSSNEVVVNTPENNEIIEGAVEEVPGDELIFEGGVSIEEEIQEEVLSDEDLDALDEETEAVIQDDGWIGSYMNENEEILTISAVDDTSVTFAFTNAGIAFFCATENVPTPKLFVSPYFSKWLKISSTTSSASRGFADDAPLRY